MPQLDIVCPIIAKAINDKKKEIEHNRFLLDQLVPITDKMEREEPLSGEKILSDIGNIIEDNMRHDKIFTDIYSNIGCKGKGLSFLLERK